MLISLLFKVPFNGISSGNHYNSHLSQYVFFFLNRKAYSPSAIYQFALSKDANS